MHILSLQEAHQTFRGKELLKKRNQFCFCSKYVIHEIERYSDPVVPVTFLSMEMNQDDVISKLRCSKKLLTLPAKSRVISKIQM